MKDLLLAIDHGTQSVRAIVFDLQGNLVVKSQIKLPPYLTPEPEKIEQDPEVFWKAVVDACQGLWENGKVQPSQIAGVAITTQRSTLINLDNEGKPLRPAITWMDLRRTEGLKPIGGLWGLAFQLSGMTNTVRFLRAEAEINWLRTYQPEIWRLTHKFLLLSGYLNYRFTGEYIDSVGSQVAYIPFDYKKKTWASRGDWKWKAVPIEPGMLPDLVQPAELIGHVTAEAALATGLPEGLPVIAAAADKACEVIGSGCLEPHQACLSYGTTATVNTTHRKYFEVIPLIPPYPSAIPGAYSMEAQIYRGYWMVSWFKREFGMYEEQLAAENGIETEQVYDSLIANIPAGSQGLILQPFWSPGLKEPGPEAKGAIIGFGDIHTRAHIYRAIIEGLAYALKEGMDRMSRRSGIAIRELRIAGGGSQSDPAMQISANIFGLPASRPHLYEASALGAAIDLAVGLGLHPSFEKAVQSMTRVGQTFYPQPEQHEIYDRLYREVYLEMYKNLKPLYTKIQDITGYPPV